MSRQEGSTMCHPANVHSVTGTASITYTYFYYATIYLPIETVCYSIDHRKSYQRIKVGNFPGRVRGEVSLEPAHFTGDTGTKMTGYMTTAQQIT